jgi:thiol-disulfide isomerase/thioredoxin
MVFLPEYRHGKFSYNGEDYKIAIASGSFSRDTTDMVYSIKREYEIFPANTSDIDFYKTGNVIFSGKSKFMIQKAALIEDTLSITFLGERKSVETGFQTGFYSPHIVTNMMDGKKFDLNEYKGKYVLLDFWGTWCAPCIKLLPDLNELQDKYKEDLVLVSIACYEENETNVKKAITNYHMNWINLYDSFDRNPVLTNIFKIKSFPTSILIDPKGEIIFRGGAQEFPALRELLEKKFAN